MPKLTTIAYGHEKTSSVNLRTAIFDIDDREIVSVTKHFSHWVLAIKIPKHVTLNMILECYNGLEFYDYEHNFYYGISLKFKLKQARISKIRRCISLKMLMRLRKANQESGIAVASQLYLVAVENSSD